MAIANFASNGSKRPIRLASATKADCSSLRAVADLNIWMTKLPNTRIKPELIVRTIAGIASVMPFSAEVNIFAPLVCTAKNSAPTDRWSLTIALSKRESAAVAVSLAPLIWALALSYAWATLNSASDWSFPVLRSLSNCWRFTPNEPARVCWNASAGISPNCPRTSSALSLPLPKTCCTAVNICCCCCWSNPRSAAVWEKASNIFWVWKPSNSVPLVVATKPR